MGAKQKPPSKLPADRKAARIEKGRWRGHLDAIREDKLKWLDGRLSIQARIPLFLEWLKPHMKEVVDWTAIGLLTFLAKHVIHTSDEITSKLRFVDIWEQGRFISGLLPELWKTFEYLSEGKMPFKEARDKEYLDEMSEWILAFVVAYLLVKHGGQILGLLGDSIKGISSIAMLVLK